MTVIDVQMCTTYVYHRVKLQWTGVSALRQYVKSRKVLILAVAWATIIFLTSMRVVTVRELSKAVSGGVGGHVSEDSFRHFWSIAWWPFVKGWHAFEFGLLYSLLRLALPGKRWMPVVLAVLFAVSDEGHQLFVPNRGCRASDVCIDCLGILAAWSLFHLAGRWRQRPWLAVLAVVLWIAALYWLSMFPFGLVTLPASSSPVGP